MTLCYPECCIYLRAGYESVFRGRVDYHRRHKIQAIFIYRESAIGLTRNSALWSWIRDVNVVIGLHFEGNKYHYLIWINGMAFSLFFGLFYDLRMYNSLLYNLSSFFFNLNSFNVAHVDTISMHGNSLIWTSCNAVIILAIITPCNWMNTFGI